jgi:mono/diheme cytochrome c family protein
LGTIAFLCFVAIRRKKGTHIPYKWHHRLATIAIVFVFVHGILGLLSGEAIELGRKGEEVQKSSFILSGAEIFNANCKVCHQNGGNIINPEKPIRGSKKVTSFDIFLAYIRNATSPMPSFSQEKITSKQARELYKYIKTEYGFNSNE